MVALTFVRASDAGANGVIVLGAGSVGGDNFGASVNGRCIWSKAGSEGVVALTFSSVIGAFGASIEDTAAPTQSDIRGVSLPSDSGTVAAACRPAVVIPAMIAEVIGELVK